MQEEKAKQKKSKKNEKSKNLKKHQVGGRFYSAGSFCPVGC